MKNVFIFVHEILFTKNIYYETKLYYRFVVVCE